MDELEAEVFTIPAEGEATVVPLLLWNYSHPDVIFEGVDSKGLQFAHLLLFRCQRGVFWGRALLVKELISTSGVRRHEETLPETRYYHVSLPGFDSGTCVRQHLCLFPSFISPELVLLFLKMATWKISQSY